VPTALKKTRHEDVSHPDVRDTLVLVATQTVPFVFFPLGGNRRRLEIAMNLLEVRLKSSPAAELVSLAWHHLIN
jgi:hypothetical protein